MKLVTATVFFLAVVTGNASPLATASEDLENPTPEDLHSGATSSYSVVGVS